VVHADDQRVETIAVEILENLEDLPLRTPDHESMNDMGNPDRSHHLLRSRGEARLDLVIMVAGTMSGGA
jgi:hypothetical protein